MSDSDLIAALRVAAAGLPKMQIAVIDDIGDYRGRVVADPYLGRTLGLLAAAIADLIERIGQLEAKE